MVVRLSIGEAFAARKRNPHNTWAYSHGPDAISRIYNGIASVRADYDGPKLTKDDPIFAMGSCFAREIEFHLRRVGCRVTSTDKVAMSLPAFAGSHKKGSGNLFTPRAMLRAFRRAFGPAKMNRQGFFHRFTPRAMLHEFRRAFDELDGWNDEESLLFEHAGSVVDFNYWHVPGCDMSREAAIVRREVGRQLVRTAAQAKVIILTLGLTESWRHLPTGFTVNRFLPAVIRSRGQEFGLELLEVEDVIADLDAIWDLVKRHHETGDFQMVVTVSPVPLITTFTGKDVIIANMDSKATLRAAAAVFCRRDGVHYFPSYEMAAYTPPKLAWRKDKSHVRPQLVSQIVRTFVGAYYEPGALGTPSRWWSRLLG